MKKIGILFSMLLLNCTFNLRSITFTATPTASERQMVGDAKDLEKEGWVISSMRTSATGSSVWEKEVLDVEIAEKELDEETYLALRTLAYLSSELRDYKKKEFVGEAQDGDAKLNQNLKQTTYYKDYPKYKNRIDDFLKLLNNSRKTVLNKRINLLSKKNLKDDELIKKRKELVLAYYNIVEDGEYYESKLGVWSRKE